MPKKTMSPLRYPGGKSTLYSYTKNIIEKNNLAGCTYIEPFAGGSSLALELLMNNIVSKLVLNDFDPCIYAFWNTVLNNADELINLIETTPINIKEWYKQKEVQLNYTEYTQLDVAFSTLFLNRTNRSGILKAGPIGGKNQDGNYRLDCRFNREDIISRIRKIQKYRSRIHFHNYDVREFLRHIVSRQKKNCFIFFDPPYYKNGPELYINFFNHDDHLELSKYIKNMNKPWLLTYDNSTEIRKMYEGENFIEYELQYSAQIKYKGIELMYQSTLLN